MHLETQNTESGVRKQNHFLLMDTVGKKIHWNMNRRYSTFTLYLFEREREREKKKKIYT